MSTTVIYNPADIEATIENSNTISSNIISMTDSVSSQISSLDSRVYSFFDSFSSASRFSSALNGETSTVDSFKNWMSETYADYLKTKNNVTGGSGGGTSDINVGSDTEFRSGDIPVGTPTYEITEEAWDKLTTEEKKVIETKLKELGFTDKEIQAIKDGKAVVNKTTLDKLYTELTKLNNNGSDVRQVILEKYGFDIFNEDGTINKDKLALAMVIDNKDPNDDYDLVALLKNKYGIDLFPENPSPDSNSNPGSVPTNPTPTDSTPNTDEPDNGQSTTTVHTGSGYGGGFSGSGEETDLSEIENMLNGEEDESLLDGLSNLSGSMLNKRDGFNIGFKDSNGKGGAGVAVAGLAGLGAAATAAGLLIKKKKEDAITDDDDDFDEEFDSDLDEDDILNDNFDEDDKTDIEENTNTNKSKKKKDWLYGLGIGLAGAGLAAGLAAKDDDEDDDDF